MNLNFIIFAFLFQTVCSLKYHLVKDNGNILSVDSLQNTVDVSDDTIAYMIYENNINRTGWANLELKTFEAFSDDKQAYSAGLLEGYITGDLIDMNYYNNDDIDGLCDDKQFCESLKVFVQNNLKFTERMIKTFQNSDYWHQLYLIHRQLDGLQMGYDLWKEHNNKTLNTTESSYFGEIFLLNLQSELSTLKHIVMPGSTDPDYNHCSAIVKPLADGSDLFVSHNTWSSYDSFLRVMKKYNFAFNSLKSSKKERIAGHSVAFPSYPGVILSMDDFYIMSSGLVVQETTNVDYNYTLYKGITADNMVYEFARNVIANRLANSGKDWTDLFGQYNSGTYNNQFMIVDYKLYKRGTKVSDLSDGLLWIIEQMPSMIRAEDVTHVLRAQGYWASYNVPYFKDQFNRTDNGDMARKYGPYFSYENNPRAKIFRRDQSKITDFKKLYAFMRYNDFKNDPLGQCKVYNQTCNPPYSGDFGIAARNDLNDPKGTYPLEDWTHRGEGAIDAKMTKSAWAMDLEMLAVNGPTDLQQPSFQWSKTDIKLRHVGHPDLFNFKPIRVKWYPNSSQVYDFNALN